MFSYYFEFLVYAAGTNAFIMHIMYKYRVNEWYELKRKLWMPYWCEPCCAFWLGIIAAGVALLFWPAFFTWFYILLLVPALAAFTIYILR